MPLDYKIPLNFDPNQVDVTGNMRKSVELGQMMRQEQADGRMKKAMLGSLTPEGQIDRPAMQAAVNRVDPRAGMALQGDFAKQDATDLSNIGKEQDNDIAYADFKAKHKEIEREAQMAILKTTGMILTDVIDQPSYNMALKTLRRYGVDQDDLPDEYDPERVSYFVDQANRLSTNPAKTRELDLKELKIEQDGVRQALRLDLQRAKLGLQMAKDSRDRDMWQLKAEEAQQKLDDQNREQELAEGSNEIQTSNEIVDRKGLVDLVGSLRAGLPKNGFTARNTLGFIPGTSYNSFNRDISRLKGALSLMAAGQIKGQGALSDSERKMLASSITKIDQGLGDKEFLEELDRIDAMLSAKRTPTPALRKPSGGAAPRTIGRFTVEVE